MASIPTCKKKEIADLLPFYVTERLSEPEIKEVERHISECAICKEEIGNLRWIFEGFSVAGGGHINSRLLTIYSESKNELSREIKQRIDEHLFSCSQCTNEFKILNRVNKSLDATVNVPFLQRILQGVPRLISKPVLKPAYAYILILALLYPAWLGFFKKDSGQGKIAEPVNIGNLFVLEQDDQRAAGEQLNAIFLDKPSDLFAFSFVLPVKNLENTVYQATISNEEKKVVWHDERLKFIDRYGTVIMVCPQKYFKEGKYSLAVIEKPKKTNEVINKYIFNFNVITK
jgi:hypothetical protein